MATITRQQIIGLINQYIYTNGNQEITAEQMHEILTDIANAFAMEGSAGTGGIEQVLAQGSAVSNGRQITNSFGGKLQLAVVPQVTNTILNREPEPEETHKYMGFNVREEDYTGQMYTSDNRTVIGGMQASDASKTLFKVTRPEKGEFSAGTVYELRSNDKTRPDGSESGPGKGSNALDEGGFAARILAKGDMEAQPSEEMPFRRGITSFAMSESVGAMSYWGDGYFDTNIGSLAGGRDNSSLSMTTSNVWMSVGSYNGSASQEINSGSVSSSVYDNTGKSSIRAQSFSEIDNLVVTGPQSTRHTQTSMRHLWEIENTTVASIDNSGFGLSQGKRLTLGSGGVNATSGVATLVSGSVMVPTTAVRSNSVISLTVQNDGTYSGNIRVGSKTPGSNFTITSASGDNCRVFWQIIDIV